MLRASAYRELSYTGQISVQCNGLTRHLMTVSPSTRWQGIAPMQVVSLCRHGRAGTVWLHPKGIQSLPLISQFQFQILHRLCCCHCCTLERIKKNAMIHHLSFVKCFNFKRTVISESPGDPIRSRGSGTAPGTHHELYGGS